MKKIKIIKTIAIIILAILLLSINVTAVSTIKESFLEKYGLSEYEKDVNKAKLIESNEDDLDPNVDLRITVTIKQIRAFDNIDIFSDPDFFVKIYVNDIEYISPIEKNKKYVNNPGWSATFNVDDYEEFVNIKIQLWDQDILRKKICDISKNDDRETLIESYDVDLIYSLKTGHWHGDDYMRSYPRFFDISGYGRLNGCDDNTIYRKDRDCEIWFDITQDDYDGDNIPYWTEVNIYNTDPEINDSGRDDDKDGVPIEWEHKWGHYLRWNWHTQTYTHEWYYNPFRWEDHKNLDPDEDGLDNVEEYLTSKWNSDPFRKDIFLEIDQMEIGPENQGAFLPDGTKDMLIDVFSRQNIVLHIDDGSMGGGQIIPFDINTTSDELREFYLKYFLNNDPNYWRRGIFHYGLVIYRSANHPGFVFSSTNDGVNYTMDCFQISTKWHETLPFKYPIWDSVTRRSFNREKQRDIIYATAIMHETGHTLGLFNGNPPGVDTDSVFPHGKEWFKFRKYKSCMNYGYMYVLLDYSDGSHGINDFDDWSNIDLTLFQDIYPWH
jgi:hypothetical protein